MRCILKILAVFVVGIIVLGICVVPCSLIAGYEEIKAALDVNEALEDMIQFMPHVGELVDFILNSRSAALTPAPLLSVSLIERVVFNLMVAVLFELSVLLYRKFGGYIDVFCSSARFFDLVADMFCSAFFAFLSVVSANMIRIVVMKWVNYRNIPEWYILIGVIALFLLVYNLKRGVNIWSASFSALKGIVSLALIYEVVITYSLLGNPGIPQIPLVICLILGILGLTLVGTGILLQSISKLLRISD